MQVMIVVTHLLGTGHLSRALTIGRAFANAGHNTTLVSGGRPAPHLDPGAVRVVQLPPVASDGTDFTRLLGADGHPIAQAVSDARQALLLNTYNDTKPDVLITELFPFGRRILRNEFLGLLRHARRASLILASVRDILAPPSKPQKVAFADETIESYYDGVLVHSDPNVITLAQSWPTSDQLDARLHYTGFVAPPAVTPKGTRAGPILVSVGGGNVGDGLFSAALDAARTMPDTAWHLVVGGDPTRRDVLADQAPTNVVVDGLRPDFRDLLAMAQVSVSMCGYNTGLDILQTGVPAVLVPFDDGGEQEQTLRAQALSHLPAITCLSQGDLSGEAVAAAVRNVMGQSRPPMNEAMDGAEETVRIATELFEKRDAKN